MQLFGNQNKKSETIDGRLVSMDQLLEKEESTISKEKSMTLIVLYFVVFTVAFPFLLSFFISLMGLSYSTHENLLEIQMVIQMAFSLLIFITSLYFARDLLKESYYAIRKHKLFLVLTSIVLWFVMLYSVSAVSMLVQTFTKELDSQNQKAVVSMISGFPVLGVYYTVIFAPIVEEIVFRGAIFRKLRTEKGFVIAMLASSLLFGSIHVISSLSSGNYLDLLNIFVYGVMGAYLCLSYEVTGSIYGPILVHFLNNFISIAMILIEIFN